MINSILRNAGIFLLSLAFAFGQTPQIFQEFNPWTGNTSPDGIWRKNGTWVATGANIMQLSNVGLNLNYAGESSQGFLSLTSQAGTMNGAEIQTLPSYGTGYYETRMKVTEVGDPSENKGVCASFFFKETNYGPMEFDFEFLTNESWITNTTSGKVHLTIHPSGNNTILDLGFNPSLAFHRYGFLWQSGHIDFVVDGVIKHTFNDTGIDASVKGYIMMNSWTGNVNWGGNPPDQDATTVYDWVKFYPGIIVLADTLPKIPVADITLSPSKATMSVGSTILLATSFSPSDATDQTYELSTSDPHIVLVDQVGSITGLNPGVCTVTTTSTDGSKTAICSITVTAVNAIDTVITHSITGISIALENPGFEVFPNPAQGVFEIKFINLPVYSECLVYNSMGQHQVTFSAGEAILPRGLYFLRSGKYTKKLIVE